MRAFAVPFLFSINVLFSVPLYAATLNVDGADATCADATGDPYCTIQAAYNAASSGDTVSVAVGTYSESLALSSSGVTITGAGTGSTLIDGGGASRVVEVPAAATVTLTDLTIQNGSAAGGAGILNSGTVTLTRVAVVSNTTSGNGGGISNTGTLTARNVTISGNSSTSAVGAGGGITSAGTVTFNNCTIASNSTFATGGGINVAGGTFTISNSIVADNSDGGAGVSPDCAALAVAPLTTGGFNIIEDITGCTRVGPTALDLTGVDPSLQSLDSTDTHPLASGSDAMEAGSPTTGDCESTDQRNFKRPVDGDFDGTALCDSGAREEGAEAPTCGDDFVDNAAELGAASGEECDNGSSNSDTVVDACRTDCTDAACGDEVIDTGEACDDGNSISGDGCESCALPSCGTGTVEPGEDCDDGNSSNTDACLNTCVDATVGDGFVQEGVEECDDGNIVAGDGCSSTGLNEGTPKCGDGILQTGEDCDGGDDCADCQLVRSGADGDTTEVASADDSSAGTRSTGGNCSPFTRFKSQNSSPDPHTPSGLWFFATAIGILGYRRVF